MTEKMALFINKFLIPSYLSFPFLWYLNLIFSHEAPYMAYPAEFINSSVYLCVCMHVNFEVEAGYTYLINNDFCPLTRSQSTGCEITRGSPQISSREEYILFPNNDLSV